MGGSLKLVCQTLLTPQGKPYLLRGMDGGWEKGKEGELGLVCKMKSKIFFNEKKSMYNQKDLLH